MREDVASLTQDKSMKEHLQQYSKEELIELILAGVAAGKVQPDDLFQVEHALMQQAPDDLELQVAQQLQPLMQAIIEAGLDLTTCASEKLQKATEQLLDTLSTMHTPRVVVATAIGAFRQLLGLLDLHPYTEQLTDPLEQVSDYLRIAGNRYADKLSVAECLTLFQLFLPVLAEAVFDQWGEYRMGLAEVSVPYLVKTEPFLLVEFFEELAKNEADPFFSRGYREFALTLQIDYLEQLDSEAAKSLMEENLNFSTILERRLELAKAANDYVKAEELISLRLHQLKNQPEYLKEEWYQQLEEIEQLAGAALTSDNELLQKTLTGDLESYLALRKNWVQAGIWQTKYPQLLYRMKKALYPHAYGTLLEFEKEWEKLYSLVWQQRTFVFSFGDALYPHYPQEITHFWKEQVFSLAAIAENQDDYIELTEEITDYVVFGNDRVAKHWLAELEQLYPKNNELKQTVIALRSDLNKSVDE